jgi:alpha-galactosidase
MLVAVAVMVERVLVKVSVAACATGVRTFTNDMVSRDPTSWAADVMDELKRDVS